MQQNNAKLSEVLDGPYLVSEWVSMADFAEYSVAVRAGDVSPREEVTIQFRKALDGSGTGPANHGSAQTFDDRGIASIAAAELGDNGSGVQYTHVSAVVSDEDSPNTYTALAFRSKKLGG